MKIQKKQKTWIEESIEKMGEKPEDFACEDIECEEKKREQAEKEMNKRLEPSKKNGEKVKGEDHVETKPLKEEKENTTSYDVKDRKELASLLEELHLTTKDVSIKRSVKEGCRYNVTLKSVLNETKEEIKEESTQEPIVEEKEIDDGPEHGYESVEVYERAQAILDEMSALRKEEEEKGKTILKAWAVDKTMSDEEFHKQSEELHNSTQEKVEKLYKELIALPIKKESLEESKKPEIDKEALEFYVKNWEEGDNITVTADLLNVLEQSLEMIKQYGSKEECLHEDVNHPLVGKKVKFKDEETTITDVEDEEDSVVFKLENGKMVDPIVAFNKVLTSDDEDVIAFIDAHKKEEPKEEPKKEEEPDINEFERGAAKANEDFYAKDDSYYNKIVKELKKGLALTEFEKGYYNAFFKLKRSKTARMRRSLDITINNTYKGDVDELISWLRNGGIASIHVTSNEDDYDRTQEVIDDLNKRDGTSYELKTTNKQGDSYEITLTTKKDILDKMPEEVKTWVAPKNSGKAGSTAEKVDANVYSERDHTLTSNSLVKDLLLNYGFHLGEYREKKESLEESQASDKKKLKYLLQKEECCSLDKQERYELQDLLNKYGYPEDLEESKKGFVTFLNLELGVLNDESDEFDYYSTAYDHKHAYYDETYLNGLESDFEHLKEVALNYIKEGVTNTYAILTSIDVQGSKDDDYIAYAIQQIEEDGFIDESVDFLDGEQFDVDNVIWSAYKDENGDIHENFVSKEEDVKEEIVDEEVLDEMAKLPYGVLAWKLNDIISSMNHEGAYYDSGWLYLWPDGESQEDCMVDFNTKETYEELKELFEKVYKRYHKDGLYTNDQSIVDYAHKIDAKLGLEPIQNLGKISDKHIGDDPYDESLNEAEEYTVKDTISGTIHYFSSEDKAKEYVDKLIAQYKKGYTTRRYVQKGFNTICKQDGNSFTIILESLNESKNVYYVCVNLSGNELEHFDDKQHAIEWANDNADEVQYVYERKHDDETYEECVWDYNDQDWDEEDGNYVIRLHDTNSYYEENGEIKTFDSKSDAESFIKEHNIDGWTTWDDAPTNESLNEVLYEEDLDDDFFTNDDMIDIEDVDDDMKVGDMSFDDKMDFLAKDEQEAIDGYDEVIDTIEDEHVKDQLEHIKEEEVAHKEFLDAVKEDPSLTYEEHDEKEEVTFTDETVEVEDGDDDFGIYESLSDKDLVDGLVANGACGDEKEAKERVARMSKEEKDELSKSIKKQAMANLIGD